MAENEQTPVNVNNETIPTLIPGEGGPSNKQRFIQDSDGKFHEAINSKGEFIDEIKQAYDKTSIDSTNELDRKFSIESDETTE